MFSSAIKRFSMSNEFLFPSSHTTPYEISPRATSARSGVHLVARSSGCGDFPLLLAPSPSARCLLYLHGNACSLLDVEPLVEAYASEVRVNVVAFEYPGYGPVGGFSCEAGVDANAADALRWILNSGFEPSDVVIFGCSIGSGGAVKLAADLCEAGTPPGALVLQSAYTSISSIVKDLMGSYVAALLLPRWNSLERLRASVTCPTLLIHGEFDPLILASHSKALFAASPAVEKELHLQPVDHNSFIERDHIMAPLKQFMLRFMRSEGLTASKLPRGTLGLVRAQKDAGVCGRLSDLAVRLLFRLPFMLLEAICGALRSCFFR
jgi:pimeloyl-ACP methyl ester carboxylesterase